MNRYETTLWFRFGGLCHSGLDCSLHTLRNRKSAPFNACRMIRMLSRWACEGLPEKLLEARSSGAVYTVAKSLGSDDRTEIQRWPLALGPPARGGLEALDHVPSAHAGVRPRTKGKPSQLA